MATYPNPAMIAFLKSLLSFQPTTWIEMLNYARKKKKRFEAICNHLKTNRFDVVFLQEVWFKKDYDRLKTCLEGIYEFSNFDSECGTNPVIMLSLFFNIVLVIFNCFRCPWLIVAV